MAEIKRYLPNFQTPSLLGAAVLSGMGFKTEIDSVQDINNGSEGDRHHRFEFYPVNNVVYFNGITLQYSASRIWEGISSPSRQGRLCLLDDHYPEHPALYQLQGLLNRISVFRHIFDGYKLYAYRWPHTTRVSYVNSPSESPWDILAREIRKDASGHLDHLRRRENTVEPSLTPSAIASLAGAREKVATDSIPIGLALMTAGFPTQTHIVGKECVFIFEPKALISSAVIPEMGMPATSQAWEAEKLVKAAETKSSRGRWNALEDLDPENPVLYVVMSILNFYHILNVIRKPRNANRFRIMNKDAGSRHAYIKTGSRATDSFDELTKLFRRRTGRYAGQVPLI